MKGLDTTMVDSKIKGNSGAPGKGGGKMKGGKKMSGKMRGGKC